MPPKKKSAKIKSEEKLKAKQVEEEKYFLQFFPFNRARIEEERVLTRSQKRRSEKSTDKVAEEVKAAKPKSKK
jgi:hypothetical protein